MFETLQRNARQVASREGDITRLRAGGKCYAALPPNVQRLAKEKYAIWRQNPYHPSLQFEERRNGICVVRVGDHYRALGLREGDTVAWFWIGTHEAYNRYRF